MHNYVSAPKAEGAVERSKAELCFGRHLSSMAGSPWYIQFDLEKMSICIESKTHPEDSHFVSIGPYFAIPLPVIPIPKGVYLLISPPKKKPFTEKILVVLKSKDGELSFDPSKVILIRANKTEVHPSDFECSWYEVDDNENEQTLIRNSGVIDIRPSNLGSTSCDLAMDSDDWTFELFVKGIEREGQAVEVPPIYFQRASNWWGDVAP